MASKKKINGAFVFSFVLVIGLAPLMLPRPRLDADYPAIVSGTPATSRQWRFRLFQFWRPAILGFRWLVLTDGRLSEFWSWFEYITPYCTLQYDRLQHCMKRSLFLYLFFSLQPLLEKDKPLLFSCDFRSALPPVDLLILPLSRSCQVCAPRWAMGRRTNTCPRFSRS